uniref:Alginate export domain-containing protein n=1 Tax=Caulobacter sp. (strain K31) TaxID=366602 RepID=B0T1M0_CAUSK
MKDGEGLAILKYEDQKASAGFDPNGVERAIDPRRDQTLSLYSEYGLTDSLTLQTKVGLTRGHDRFVDYSGRGPIELGLRYALLRTDRSVVSLYLGAAKDGVGRNAGYAYPGQGDTNLEVRLLAGTSRQGRRAQSFAEVQVARLRRNGLADETRFDATVGLRPAPHWLLMAQAYAGQADSKPVRARWLKQEISITRDLGAWSLQAGWRRAASGREVAADHGPVLAVWRRF